VEEKGEGEGAEEGVVRVSFTKYLVDISMHLSVTD